VNSARPHEVVSSEHQAALCPEFEARIRELVTLSQARVDLEPLLAGRRIMQQQFAVLHKSVLDTVRHVLRPRNRPRRQATSSTGLDVFNQCAAVVAQTPDWFCHASRHLR
jgi:hypothetical protein